MLYWLQVGRMWRPYMYLLQPTLRRFRRLALRGEERVMRNRNVPCVCLNKVYPISTASPVLGLVIR